jgi:hypothetical protein
MWLCFIALLRALFLWRLHVARGKTSALDDRLLQIPLYVKIRNFVTTNSRYKACTLKVSFRTHLSRASFTMVRAWCPSEPPLQSINAIGLLGCHKTIRLRNLFEPPLKSFIEIGLLGCQDRSSNLLLIFFCSF